MTTHLQQAYQAALDAFHNAPDDLSPEQVYCLYYEMRDLEDALRAEESRAGQLPLLRPVALAVAVGALAALSSSPSEAAFTYTPVGASWAVVETLPSVTQNLPVRAATAMRVLNPWSATVGLGLTVGALLLQDMLDNLVQTTPANNAPTPAGWSDSNTPPTVTPSFWKIQEWNANSPVYNTTYPSNQAACEGVVERFNWSSPGVAPFSLYQCSPQSALVKNAQDTCCNVMDLAHLCPEGYSLNGEQCTLTNATAAKWQSDGVPTYQSTGNGWRLHPRDPDPGDPNIAPNSTTPILLTRDGLDEFFNRVRDSVSSTPDGGITYRQQIEVPDPVGNTTTVDRSITINNEGDVVENTQSTTQTTINQSGAQAVPPSNIELPTDYAREETLQQVRDSLTQPADLPTQEGAPTFQETLDAFWSRITTEGLIGAVSNIVIPEGTGACPTGSFDFLGTQLTLDSHCALLESVSPALMVVSLAAYSLLGLRIILSA